MSSTPTTSLRLEEQGTGDNLNSWGTRLNSNMITLVDDAIAGITTKALTTSVSLTSVNYATDESRKAILAFTDGGLSGTPTVTIPAVPKQYIVHNKGATYNVTLTAGGTTTSVRPGVITPVYCDGTNVFSYDPTLDIIKAPAAALSLNSKKITNLADGTADTDAVNKLQVTSLTSADVTSCTSSATAAAASATSAASSASSASSSATSATASAASASASDASCQAVLSQIAGGPVASIAGLTGVVSKSQIQTAMFNRTSRGDASYTILTSDSVVAITSALTSPRTFTLPAASAYPAGFPLKIEDEVGGVGSTNTLTIARAGSDTINGGTSVVLSHAYDTITLVSDGSSKWTIGYSPRATTAQAQTGTDDQALMTPARTSDAIAALGRYVKIAESTGVSGVSTTTFTAGAYSEIIVSISGLSGSGTASPRVKLSNGSTAIVTLNVGTTFQGASETFTGRAVFVIDQTSSKFHFGNFIGAASSAGTMTEVFGSGTDATAPDRVVVDFTSGTPDAGTICVYGLRRG